MDPEHPSKTVGPIESVLYPNLMSLSILVRKQELHHDGDATVDLLIMKNDDGHLHHWIYVATKIGTTLYPLPAVDAK